MSSCSTSNTRPRILHLLFGDAVVSFDQECMVKLEIGDTESRTSMNTAELYTPRSSMTAEARSSMVAKGASTMGEDEEEDILVYEGLERMKYTHHHLFFFLFSSLL